MIRKITIAMNLCVNWYYITDFDLELLEIILDFHCLFFLPNSIKQFTMNRPVEKMNVKELKGILLRKKVSLKKLTVKGPTCWNVSNPMIKYTRKL